MSEFWQRARIEGGEIKDGETRYVVFRADVIADMVKQLPEVTQQQVLESFQTAVTRNGGRSLETYLKMLGNEHRVHIQITTSVIIAHVSYFVFSEINIVEFC